MWTITRTYELAPGQEDMYAWEDHLVTCDATVSQVPGGGVTVTVHVVAASALAAMQETTVVDDVVGEQPVGVEVLTEAEHQRRAQRASLPELMSAADIAHELGVSRQRVHQLRTTAQFPAPLAELRGGAVWDGAAIRAFAQTWARKPGRPVSTVPEVRSMHILVPSDMPEAHLRHLIRAELNRTLEGTGVWAMRFQYREDPTPAADGDLRRYEVVYGTVPGSPTDETIPDLPGYKPSRFDSSAEHRNAEHHSPIGRYSIVTNKRIVQHRDDGNWEVRKPGADRASRVVGTQSEGIDRARTILGNDGGGELQVRGRDGTIRAQDTIAPGNDPRRSKG